MFKSKKIFDNSAAKKVKKKTENENKLQFFVRLFETIIF